MIIDSKAKRDFITKKMNDANAVYLEREKKKEELRAEFEEEKSMSPMAEILSPAERKVSGGFSDTVSRIFKKKNNFK